MNPTVAACPTSVRKDFSTVRRGFALVATAGLLVVGSQLPAAAAPNDTSADTTTANVGVSSSITLSGLTPAFTLTGLPGATVAETDAVAYNVNTNNVGGYAVNVQAAAAALTPAGTSSDTIPIDDLSVRDGSGTGAYTALSNTSAVTLHTKDTRSVQAGDDYTDDYSVAIPFVASDTYSVTLDYVATAS